MTFAILGGILLNIGAYLTYKGKIYQAVVIYLMADICWMVMAFVREDMWGAFFITVGTILGFLAYLKMRRGEMKKSLNHEPQE